MKYRPDIDGLRAIAIGLVLMYHGGLSLFPSGFIGVDVFFVISGFLITGIIHTSLDNNKFSFVDFYNRRLWRLQPVLVCLIFVATAAALLFYLPEDLIQYSRSARKTSLFLSNQFFNQYTTGYFSPDSQQLPLLHTWSLSIEWQCYLILPIIMYLLHRFLSKKNILFWVSLLTLASLVCATYYAKTEPGQTYYLFSSRFFEFLIGSCVALVPKINHSKNTHILNIIGGFALACILYIGTFERILVAYPNQYALLVCLATGLLIWIGEIHQNTLITRILSIKPLVFIGLISYSLYIWHWVVFAILRYQSVAETAMNWCIAYAAIFVLAYVSWRFIEKPSRQFKKLRFRTSFAVLILLPVLAIHLTSFIIKANTGFPQRFNQELITIYQQLDQYNSERRPLCISNDKTDMNAICHIGAEAQGSKKALMIGDSFSNHYWGFMDTIGKQAKVSILVQGTSSCITLPGIHLYDWWHFKNAIYDECTEQTQRYYRMIQENHYDYVILGQIWPQYLADNIINNLGEPRSLDLSKKRLRIAIDKALETITASGAKPVLILSTALTPNNINDCFFKHIKMHQSYDSKQCSFSLDTSRAEDWFVKVFHQLKSKYPQMVVIDPKKIQCHNNVCSADINGIPVYRDSRHITDYASYHLGEMYLKEFHNPLS